MPSFKSKPGKLFAREIAAYSDTDLDKYLEANGRCVRVEDPENLTEEFIGRLKARADPNNTARPHPVDLGYLTTRLEEISANRQVSPRPSSPASVTTEDDPDDSFALQNETGYYNRLVNEGGRPSHPISLGRDIITDPGEYREILSFWQIHEEDWMVFGRQLSEWQRFRDQQCRMREQGRFPVYHQAAQDRLRRNGFERSFRLNEERARQDKPTTWIEFLNYEYMIYEKEAKTIQRLQPRIDEAWKKVVDSKLLGSFETEEYRETYRHALQVRKERFKAVKAVESAYLAMRSAEKALQEAQSAGLCEGTLHQKKQRLSLVQSKLEVVEKSRDAILKTTDEFYRRTQRHERSKKNAERRSILVRWALLQTPLVELESKVAMAAQNGLSEEAGEKKRCLKRKCSNPVIEEGISKRRKEGSGDDALPKATCAPKTPATCPDPSSTLQPRQPAEGERQLKRKRDDATDEGRSTKRRRPNDYNQDFSSGKTLDVDDSTPIEEPPPIQPPASRDLGAPTARNKKACFTRHPVPGVAKPRSQPKRLAKVVLDEEAWPPNSGNEGQIFSHVSAVEAS
ncbi:hypothetical protein MMC30_003867 [Trapelia coarctata]|nr:hypothetical protein [Trapelia coarctata]